MKLKKIVTWISILMIFFSGIFIVKAETCNNDSIKLVSIDFLNKQGGVEETATIEENTIKLDVKLYEVDDYVKYKVILKNDSDEDYRIENLISQNNNSIIYEMESPDNNLIIKENETKEIYLYVRYINKVAQTSFENGEYKNTELVSFTFTNNKNNLINPKTYNNIGLLCIMILLITGILITYKKTTNKKNLALLIGLFLLFPEVVYSMCVCTVNIDANITIPEYQGRSLKNIIKDGAFDDDKKSEFVDSNDGINFLSPSSDTNGKGNYLFASTKNDENPIYYYRGIVENNYVLFANNCWRMIRTTSSGGIKIVYHGVPTDGKCLSEGADTEIATGVNYNASYNNTKSFGYNTSGGHVVKSKTNGNIANGTIFANDVTYENGEYILNDDKYIKDDNYSTERDANITNHHYTCFKTTESGCASVNYIFMTRDQGNYYVILSGGEKIEDLINNDITNQSNDNKSDVRSVVDDWYNNNLTSFTDYLEDTIWCNDRSIYSLGGWDKNGDPTTKLTFNVNDRVANTGKISLGCSNQNDSFTTLVENGNGKLDYPIGLLTLDEGALAGYAWYEESETYLSNGQVWWTMSPSLQSAVYMYTGVIHSMNDNVHTAYRSNGAGGVRPAIALKSIVTIENGDGTKENPFTINEISD